MIRNKALLLLTLVVIMIDVFNNNYHKCLAVSDQWRAWLLGEAVSVMNYIVLLGIFVIWPPIKDKTVWYFSLKNIIFLWIGYAITYLVKEIKQEFEMSFNEWLIFYGFVVFEIGHSLYFYKKWGK